MPITGLNVLNTFHHTSKADRWIEVKPVDEHRNDAGVSLGCVD